MKGLISGIKRMEVHDGEGLRTTVFFKGCPLKCIWCHNPESISFAPQVAFFKQKCIECGACHGEKSFKTAAICPTGALFPYGREYEVEELVNTVMEDAPFFADGGGGVTLSGGECLAQSDFAVSLAREFYLRGISVFVDTCGYVRRETFAQIIPYVDKFLYDIKAIDPEIHKKCTGKDNRIILENLRYLSDAGCKIEIRYPIVKGFNHEECESIAKTVSGVKGIVGVKVLQYHSFAASRYESLGMENTMPVNETTLYDVEKAVEKLKSYGLTVLN